ncbi:phosphotransferase system enzyme I (PtsI) [Desulfomicrobium macestii]|jgi:phosphotransferase system enzyme I (PtsI)|uniref:Phosphoenolpyruvate-protein phosphotransferase n=2 Tax=Desulfomicrobium TaxID=898 RepID=A0A8G2C1D2_DESNO|nr:MULTISPECIES: phosphoenolpyruvate--protein phosphotransferase [Desulfomicrobium]MBE1426341.1 phosphotransferase system enzyme I (PtsI) [Desulfomicrobium macestii]SFL47599.1 phosphotransferase system, enzyme I, PtsI [Desulfomicrobium norvegicum]
MASRTLFGIPVSAGIAIGRAYYLNKSHFSGTVRQTVSDADVPFEIERLNRAFDDALHDLERILTLVPEDLKEHSAIIESHLMMLRDQKFRKRALDHIALTKINAEWSLERAVGDVQEIFASIADEYLRQRMQDVRLVAERVLGKLVGGESGHQAIKHRAILLAHDLSPADTIELDVNKIMAFATAQGGKTSHAGILARSLQIPAVVGMEGLGDDLAEGGIIILDGFHGRIIIDPDEDELARYTDLQAQFEGYQATIMRSCHLPAETIDGYRVQVLANIELFEEVVAVNDNGGEGIGLFRSEYSYLNRDGMPTEDELTEIYMDMASLVAPKKLVIRTLDVGADKLMRMQSSAESNPALGLRAIRYCLKHREVFRTQLRAILKASVLGNVSIMFPMISGLQELVEVKKFYREVQEEMHAEGICFREDMPMGIMIEVPSAVITADFLAREVDFFSIGTNDLIQYSLGIDRTNKDVSYLYQPLHPAIVRSIKWVVDSAHRAGIEVCLCGELAADPFCIPVLMGMQVDSISLGPQSIPGIKRIVRQASMEECNALLKQVMASHSVARNNKLVREMIFRRFPEELMFYSSLVDD